MTDEELKLLGAKAATLPTGRNELSPKPLAAVMGQAIVDPQGRVRIYNSTTGEVVTLQQVDGDAIANAADLTALKTAVQNVLSASGLATFT